MAIFRLAAAIRLAKPAARERATTLETKKMPGCLFLPLLRGGCIRRLSFSHRVFGLCCSFLPIYGVQALVHIA